MTEPILPRRPARRTPGTSPDGWAAPTGSGNRVHPWPCSTHLQLAVSTCRRSIPDVAARELDRVPKGLTEVEQVAGVDPAVPAATVAVAVGAVGEVGDGRRGSQLVGLVDAGRRWSATRRAARRLAAAAVSRPALGRGRTGESFGPPTTGASDVMATTRAGRHSGRHPRLSWHECPRSALGRES